MSDNERKTVDWDAVRIDYENGMSFRSLASKYHASKSYIIEKRNKGDWKRLNVAPSNETQGSNTRDVNAAIRVQTAIKLRAQRLTWEEVAKRSGYASRGAAHNAVMNELHKNITEDIKQLRAEEFAMLDILHAEMWELAMDHKNVYRTYAADRVLSISEARRKLMGMDRKPEDEAANQHYIKRIIIETENHDSSSSSTNH